MRLLKVQILQQVLKAFAVFGQINRVGRGAKDRNAFFVQRIGQFQRGLAAKLHDHAVQGAVFLLDPQDFQHMFKRQRFEIQPVRGVIIGGNRFRVAVDHDGFIARRRQRIAGMAAAIIKLDALADAVWATAKDNHLFRIRRPRFAFHIAHRGGLVGGIHIGGLRFEFGGTGVDAFEGCDHAQIAPRAADLRLFTAGQGGKAGIGKAHHLQFAQAICIERQARAAHFGFHVDDFADAGQEPRIKRRNVVDLVVRQPVAHGLGDDAQTVWGLLGQRLGDRGPLWRAFNRDLVKAREAGFQRGQRLLHRFVDGAADGHHLAHRFHRRGQIWFRSGEFLEGKARDLGDDIVDRGLKAGGGDFGDVVVQLVQRIANGQFRRDLGNRKAGRLGGQRR